MNPASSQPYPVLENLGTATDFAVLTRTALDALLASHVSLGSKFLLVLLSAMTRYLRQANDRLGPHIQVVAV